MRFHVVSLPHTHTTKAFSWCAYTEKVRKFCNMMSSLGHQVFLYANEKNEAVCHEHIVTSHFREENGYIPQFSPTNNYFLTMNGVTINELEKRLQPKDFICLIGGTAQKPIADAFPNHMTVEFGVGYGGVFAPYRVFESYAWMHTVYGSLYGTHEADGRFYDAVIPNYFEDEDFPYAKNKGDYYLFIGRLIDRKGYKIASDVCKHLGRKLIIAGSGTPPEYGEYVGVVGPKERGELMSRAIAVFAPTLYIEPFGGVTAEAMMCGTPVITTDWGAFSETVIQGETGFRCRTLQEFVNAAKAAAYLESKKIRKYAQQRFSTDSVKYQYEKYFERLLDLWDEGWVKLDKPAAV